MSLKRNYQASLEAIKYQGLSPLAKDLIKVIDDYAKRGHKGRKDLERDLETTVKKHTNMNFEFEVDPGELAYTLPMIITTDSKLLYHELGTLYQVAVQELIKDQQKSLKNVKERFGTVDLEKSKVTGVFEKLTGKIVIGTVLVNHHTPQEAAAVILHEIGHNFAAFEMLTATATSNLVARTTFAQLQENTDSKIRFQLLEKACKTLEIAPDDLKALAEQPNLKEETIHTIFLKERLDRIPRSTTGSRSYDTTTFEFLADQFATRHGLGAEVVTLLSKYELRMGPRMFVFIQVIEVLNLMFMTLVTYGLWMLVIIGYLCSSNMNYKIYDTPTDRYSRVRRDLIASLKDPNLKASFRTEILASIAKIDKVMGDFKDRRSLKETIWTFLTSHRREQHRNFKLQKEMETLLNNDMFIHSAQLKQVL